MYKKLITLVVTVTFLVVGCKKPNKKTGKVITINYEKVKVKSGEWIQIDSFKFEHVGKITNEEEAKFPVPSSEVIIENRGMRKKRTYNSKVFPIYISKFLQKINERLPSEKEFLVANKFMLLYKGKLKILKRDSSEIEVRASKNYEARIKTEI